MSIREIKFRAFIKNLIWLVPVEMIDFSSRTVEVDLSAGNGDTSEYGFDEIELMQFTGLKDKAETEIFEGDLVRTYEPEEGRLLEKIIYENGSFRVNCLSGEKIDCPIGSILSKYIEVVGNVHENKDLLEQS